MKYFLHSLLFAGLIAVFAALFVMRSWWIFRANNSELKGFGGLELLRRPPVWLRVVALFFCLLSIAGNVLIISCWGVLGIAAAIALLLVFGTILHTKN